MPLELTDEQRKEFDAEVAREAERIAEEKIADKVLSEDDKKILRKRNALIEDAHKRIKAMEAELAASKTNADRAAELEKELQKVKDAETERVKAEETARREAEKKNQTLEQRLETLATTFEDKLNYELSKRDQKSAEEQQKMLAELSKRDQRILMEAVRAEATKAGILDDELVSLLDLKTVQIQEGVPDRDKIVEIVAAHKEAKPHFYKDEASGGGERRRGPDGKFIAGEEGGRRPDPNKKTEKVDWGKLSDAEFKAKEEEFRRSLRG